MEDWRRNIDRRYRAAKSDGERQRIFAEALGAPLAPVDKLGERGAGGARVVGGVAQIVAGKALLAAPEPVVTKVLGGALIARGADNVQAGVRQAWTGEPTQSGTGVLLDKGYRAAGASPETAGWLSAGTEFGLDLGLGYAAARATPLRPATNEPLTGIAKESRSAVKAAPSADAVPTTTEQPYPRRRLGLLVELDL